MGRVVRIATGSTLVVAGTAMLVLPGPGLLTIAAGIAVLAKDIAWARRLRRRFAGDGDDRSEGQDGG